MADLSSLLGVVGGPGPDLALIGLGNPDRSDDGCGLLIAKELKTRSKERVFSEEERPAESLVLDCLEDAGIKRVLFVDAMDFGGEPGEIALFGAEEAERFMPAFSTHKVPITLLMEMIRQEGKAAFILGIQPGDLTLMGPFTPEVLLTAERVIGHLAGLLGP